MIRPRMKGPLAVRFWLQTDRSNPDGCWPWIGTRNRGGYGSIRRGGLGGGKTIRATHVAWELAFGPVPSGLFVLHRCDNPPCVNPAHLFIGTLSDNARDKFRKGRGFLPTPIKLGPDGTKQAHALRAAGLSIRRIGQTLGVTGAAIYFALRRRPEDTISTVTTSLARE
jgi:hypothetical protein